MRLAVVWLGSDGEVAICAVCVAVSYSGFPHCCYTLSWGGPDPEFRFGFRVLETGVGMDGASESGSLRRLDFCIQYLARGGGHAMECDGKASDWTKGDDDKQRSNTKEFIQQ